MCQPPFKQAAARLAAAGALLEISTRKNQPVIASPPNVDGEQSRTTISATKGARLSTPLQNPDTAIEEYFSRIKNGDEEVFKELRESYSEEQLIIAIGVFKKCLFELSDATHGRMIYLASDGLEEMRKNLGGFRVHGKRIGESVISIYEQALHRNDRAVQTHVINGNLLPLFVREPKLVTIELISAIGHVLENGGEWPRRYAFETLQSVAADPRVDKNVGIKAKRS